jgi:RNA polymerase sigma factor (sigma-70 family)
MDMSRNGYGETYFTSERKPRLSHAELKSTFQALEDAEQDCYHHFISYKPLALYCVQHLHEKLLENKEMESNDPLDKAIRALEQSYFYDTIEQQPLIDFILPSLRLLIGPREWSRHILDVVSVPEALADMDEFMSSPILSDPEYLEWAKEASLKCRIVLGMKNQFIERNRGLVITLVKRHFMKAAHSCSLRDLQQEGIFGLMKAVDKFDHTKDYLFSTYANWWIRHHVTRALQDRDRVIRIPVHVCEKTQKLRKAQRRYYQLYGTSAPPEWLEEQSGVPRHQFEEYLSTATRISSLDAKMSTDEGEGDDFLSRLVDNSLVDPSEIMLKNERRKVLNRALQSLDKREADIIRMRFGFTDGPQDDSSHTLNQIGEEYGLSRERIRQIEDSALAKMRKMLGSRAKTLSFE